MEGLRKSGIPAAVDTPAPERTTRRVAWEILMRSAMVSIVGGELGLGLRVAMLVVMVWVIRGGMDRSRSKEKRIYNF